MTDPAAPISARQEWARACMRIAWAAAVFSLALGGLLVTNTYHLHRGPENAKMSLVEARELLPLKTALRDDPKNEALKQQIRQLDRQLRRDYFRREQMANRGAWLLLVGAATCLSALQLARHLGQPPVAIPRLTARPPDPVRAALIVAKAVTATILGLVGLTITLFWSHHRKWQGDLTQTVPLPAATAAGRDSANDPGWFPSAAEVAANWPYFRGPAGTGTTTLANLPESWDAPAGQNVLWQSSIDLPGENSPIIWGKQIFLTGATATRRELYCYDSLTGALLWKTPVGTPQSERSEPPEVNEDTGFAAPTAATDGRRVCAMFANGDIAGFTTSGKRLWARNLGPPENTYGHATSLTMWHNRVIVVFDQADAEAAKSKIMALDASTGDPVWSTPRPVGNSWVSPIVISHHGHEQIITCADPWVIAYDPATGKELWKANCLRGDVATSPTYANDLVYVACDQTCVAAIHPDGTGDVTGEKIAWKYEDGGLPDICSLLCDGPRVYTMVFGILHAFDALTGEHLWEFDTKARFQASPAMANGSIYLLSGEGVMIVGKGGKDGFKEISRSPLGEGSGASPAFAPGRIYLRGKKHLFCIGSKDGN